jgi:membrane protease YdiL (CAAX protease family)
MTGIIDAAKNSKNKRLAITVIGIYVLLRMVADPFFWRYVSEIYSYAFEIIFVSATYFFFKEQVKVYRTPDRKDFQAASLMLLVGLVTYHGASLVHAPIPFDLSSSETVFLLLVLSPLLEELIFRMALWEAFEVLFKKNSLTLFATTILFAAGHFAAYWFVPEQYQSFVIYQTLYAGFLGLIAGWRRMRSDSITSGVWIHFAFNLGFFIASKVFV